MQKGKNTVKARKAKVSGRRERGTHAPNNPSIIATSKLVWGCFEAL
jgi:hypothetical protein